MQEKSGVTLTSTVNFILNPELKKFYKIYREIHKNMLKIFVEIRFEVLRVYYHTIVRSKYPSSITYKKKILEKMLKTTIEIRFKVLSVCEPFLYKIYRPQFCKM